MKTLYENINSELLLEKFETVLPADSNEDQLKYAKQVWPMIEDAYKYIGGLAGIKTLDAFVKEFVDNEKDDFLWKLVRRGSEIPDCFYRVCFDTNTHRWRCSWQN